MTKLMRHAVVFFALLFLLGSGWAQRHHDPLNDSEVDQLRETAQEPAKRMKLYVGFAKARMEMIQHLRADRALMGKDDEEMRSRLEDLATLVDEIDDNLD